MCSAKKTETYREWDLLPAYFLPATIPQQTKLELCPLYLGKGLHETPGLNAGRQYIRGVSADIETLPA